MTDHTYYHHILLKQIKIITSLLGFSNAFYPIKKKKTIIMIAKIHIELIYSAPRTIVLSAINAFS